MSDDMEYNDMNINLTDEMEIEKRVSKKSKVVIIILSCIIVLCVAVIAGLTFLYLNKNKEQKKEEEKKEEENKDEKLFNFIRKAFEGNKYFNLTYAEKTVTNTFKKGGVNYRPEIGDVFENKDYEANKYNIYDLYLPYSALKTNKTKGIILWIHGGAWFQGVKEELNYLCPIYFDQEYIIANMDYTLLGYNAPNMTIYRIIDDIYACLEDIKKRLVKMGFNENELEVAVGGGSAGGHLSLLYGYLVKSSPIPVKFIIDTIGPVNLEIDDYYVIKDDDKTLPDIEPETVENALKNNHYEKPLANDNYILLFLNYFVGCKYSPEDLKKMLKNNQIDKNNTEYQKLFKEASYGFPITVFKKESA